LKRYDHDRIDEHVIRFSEHAIEIIKVFTSTLSSVTYYQGHRIYQLFSSDEYIMMHHFVIPPANKVFPRDI